MPVLQDLIACTSQAWHPKPGDATPGGLALAVLYIVASLLFLRVVLVPRTWLPRERLLWGTASAILLIMTLDKPLDLQHSLNAVGKCLSHDGGWDRQRVWVQRILGAGLILGVIGATTWFLRRCRAALAANRPLMLGIALMTLFIALEIARFEGLLGAAGKGVARLNGIRILEAVAVLALIRAGWLRGARRN